MSKKSKSNKKVEDPRIKEYYMHLLECRLASFDNWLYKAEDNCKCTAEAMARAGFYHCPTANEPDAAKCFTCQKELDGWEPDDDPWEEHCQHAENCAFLKQYKPFQEMTVKDFLQAECVRQKAITMKFYEMKICDFEEQAKRVCQEMEKLQF